MTLDEPRLDISTASLKSNLEYTNQQILLGNAEINLLIRNRNIMELELFARKANLINIKENIMTR